MLVYQPIIADVSKDRSTFIFGIKQFAAIDTAYHPQRLQCSTTPLPATHISQLQTS